ncbi:2OG-Fe(II) oxygenase [Roseibium sp. RKSG952]|uniref:HalD/BesD family halogenase n=1 Tax=Roseibium sp. RKSG952 TaxID=2529384 RepID=UPI0012BD34CE|nr:2OG-Fe(II) oxygenase [Roseibium sp. RKSG952]MTI03741.1 2OG-Fe(II) oxygenase [Roseibium sp. RKSG952]
MRDILDLDRFPIDRPGSAEWNNLVENCRNDLEQDGMFNLDGLMRGQIAAQAVSDMAPRFESEAFLHERRHNIYFKKIADLPEGHPALQEFQTSNRTLCADQIDGSALLRLYEWPEFAQFLAATMGKPALHVMDDPLARVNVMSYQEGQALNWHFDRSEFTTTMLLQAPDQGGGFEYRTDLRSDTDPNYDGVAQLLSGGDDQSKVITLSPGTLNVFKGKNTAHRVTPVGGDKARVIAVFSYYENPGVTFTEAERIGFYGRA